MASKKVTFKIGVQDDASSKLKKLSGNLGGLKNAAGAALKAITIVGTAMTVAAGFGLNAAAKIEKMRVALKTSFQGSAEEAEKAFTLINDFAKTTPFQLGEVMDGFIKLKNMGLDPSESALTSYGDTASAMGKSLNQMIEAVADAATGEFERLKEFGIRASSEGDNVTFTFQGVKTTVKKEASAIEDYLKELGETKFAGGMEEQSKTLEGRMSTLKDTFNLSVVSIVEDSGLLDTAKDTVIRLTEAIENNKNIFNETKEKAGEFFRAINDDSNVVVAFIKNFFEPIIEDLRETFVTSWQDIKAAIEPIKPELEFLAKFFGVIFLGAVMVAIKIFAKFVEFIVSSVTFLIDTFATLWKQLELGVTFVVQAITGDFEGAWNTIKEGAENMVNYVIRQINKLIRNINKVPGIDIGEIGSVDFRADGGPVSQGSSYVVGERGPEMFVPNQSGTIVPNGGGGQTFNFDFSGATVTNEDELVQKITRSFNRQLELANMGLA